MNSDWLEDKSEELTESGKKDIQEAMSDAGNDMILWPFKVLNQLVVLVSAVVLVAWIPAFLFLRLTHGIGTLKDWIVTLPLPFYIAIGAGIVIYILDRIIATALGKTKEENPKS